MSTRLVFHCDRCHKEEVADAMPRDWKCLEGEFVPNGAGRYFHLCPRCKAIYQEFLKPITPEH